MGKYQNKICQYNETTTLRQFHGDRSSHRGVYRVYEAQYLSFIDRPQYCIMKTMFCQVQSCIYRVENSEQGAFHSAQNSGNVCQKSNITDHFGTVRSEYLGPGLYLKVVHALCPKCPLPFDNNCTCCPRVPLFPILFTSTKTKQVGSVQPEFTVLLGISEISIEIHSTNTSSRGQYLSRKFTCMPMARLQQLFYQMLHVFSIKNNRATISSSSFTTAPREGLTLRANGISLDFSGNLRFKKKIGWYVS